MDVFGITVNCGSLIIEDCRDMEIPWGADWTFEMLVGDLVDAAGALVKYGLQYAGDSLSENLVRALNALRCALSNLGTNAWNLVAATYWTMVGVGEGATAVEYLDIGYEYICTCQEDAMELVRALGGGEENQDGGNKILSSCSESAAVRRADAEQDREAKREASAEAEAEAEREQEAEEAREAEKAKLASATDADLELALAEALKAL